MSNQLFIIIGSLTILMIFIIIVFVLILTINNDSKNKSNSQENSLNTINIIDSNTTENNSCQNDSDCSKNLICDFSVKTCVPLPAVGESCTKYSERCPSGTSCTKSKVIDILENDLYPDLEYSIIDILEFNLNNIIEKILLLNNGDIILDKNNSLKFIKSNIPMRYLIRFENHIYGISSGFQGGHFDSNDPGLLYKLNSREASLKWTWTLQEWAPKNIIHISNTYDFNYLWLQDNTYKGYLYKYIFPKQASLQEEIQLQQRFRNYGNNIESYVEFSPGEKEAILYPTQLKIENVFYSIILPDESIFNIDLKDINKFCLIRVINKKPVYVTKKLCL